jgi:hypothetical protein
MSDLELMYSPEEWPWGELLPLQRGRGREEGFLFCPISRTAPAPVLYLGNLFAVDSGTPFKDIPQKRYASLEAIVADGWVVD